MAWIRKKLRGATVLARCDESGSLVAEGGRVEIRYKPNDGRAYRAGAGNLKSAGDDTILPDSHCGDAEAAAPKKAGKKKSAKKGGTSGPPPPHEDGAVIVYADGACSGNPGPSGLGVVVLDGEERSELSEFLGRGTNNIAELTAILRAAELLRDTEKPVRIYTDSKYSIGVLTLGWKAKKNPELIARAKEALAALDDVKLYYVKGHAGIALNERADELATTAVGSARVDGVGAERSGLGASIWRGAALLRSEGSL